MATENILLALEVQVNGFLYFLFLREKNDDIPNMIHRHIEIQGRPKVERVKKNMANAASLHIDVESPDFVNQFPYLSGR